MLKKSPEKRIVTSGHAKSESGHFDSVAFIKKKVLFIKLYITEMIIQKAKEGLDLN